jgi:hypothetical protein
MLAFMIAQGGYTRWLAYGFIAFCALLLYSVIQ